MDTIERDDASRAPVWDIAGVLALLRRRRAWVVGAAVGAVVLTLLASLLMTSTYRGEVDVVVDADVGTTDPALVGRTLFMDQELATQLRLVRSEPVLRRVIGSLGLDEPVADVQARVEATLLPQTRVIRISGSSPDPQAAADLAQAVADEYLAFRREETAARLDEATASLQARVERGRAEVDRLDQQLDQAETQSRIASLVNERDAVTEELAAATAQLDRLTAAEALARGGGTVIEPATTPESPSEPQVLRNVVVALVLGLGLGLVLALVVDAVDDAVHDEDDASAAAGRPVLGRIPQADTPLPLLRAPTSPAAEAHRDLRAALRFVGAGGTPASITVTSSVPGEGKSVVAANLALAAASAGRSVVLVDADLRDPAQGHLLDGPGGGSGLSTVLAGEHELDDVLFTHADAGLDLVFAGDRPPNPSELLGSDRMASLLAELAERYELVVIDVPPVLVVPDALEVADGVDATLVVVARDDVGRREVQDTVRRLERVGGRVPGVVLNRTADPREQYGELAGAGSWRRWVPRRG